MEITSEDVMKVLKEIETGEITLFLEDTNIVNCGWGTIDYKASNGWTISVFEYEFTWDYIESITSPDGTKIYLREGEIREDPNWDEVILYRPPKEVIQNVYLIPDDSNEIYTRGIEVSAQTLIEEMKKEKVKETRIRQRKRLKRIQKGQI